MLANFHFLRPYWLLTVFPLLTLFWKFFKHQPHLQSWSAICDKHLLTYLVKNRPTTKRRSALLFLLISSLFIVFGLAGPTWQRLPVPSYQMKQPRVIVLDMSENMANTDLAPDRLTRAKFKLHDLFDRTNVGQFALVVFTGEPFVVSPLTDDGKTIDALLAVLTPEIMPVGGKNLSLALDQAAQLIMQAGFTQGQILVLTASPPNAQAITMAEKLAQKGILTSVIPVVANTTLTPLFQPLAKAGQGVLLPFSDTAHDLDQWLQKTNNTQQLMWNEHSEINVWRDEGRWFFTSSVVSFVTRLQARLVAEDGFMIKKCLLLLVISCNSYAFSWQDLWFTPNQQAQKLMKKKQYEQAANLFQQLDWQASAAYRAGDYQQAAKIFQQIPNELGYYDAGNALAHLEKYEEAIKAYNQALAINPTNKDALYNRKLIESLLKKQQQKSPKQSPKQSKGKEDKKQGDKQQDQKDKQDKKDQQDKQQSDNQQDKSDSQTDKQQQAKPEKDDKQNTAQNSAKAPSASEREKQQAKEQWLRLIPDDPGGLMREKFLRDYIRRQRGLSQ